LIGSEPLGVAVLDLRQAHGEHRARKTHQGKHQQEKTRPPSYGSYVCACSAGLAFALEIDRVDPLIKYLLRT
jgi:hypothetical protein